MNETRQGFKFLPFVISIAVTLGIGGVASAFTIPEIKGWYVHLNKPAFNPPNWLFGPVWTFLYIMIAIAAYLVWERRKQSSGFTNARLIYFVQLFLNFCWSIVFFGMHQILGALIVIVLLFISILVNIRLFGQISRVAGWLLVPYLAWVSFAGILNLSVYLLNR